MYADDTQLYISFPPTNSHSPLSLLSSTLDLVHTWFTNNRLSLNQTKTEYIIIGTPIPKGPPSHRAQDRTSWMKLVKTAMPQ